MKHYGALALLALRILSISFLSCRAQATLGRQMASIWSATLSPLLVFTAMKQGEQAGSWSVLSPAYCYDC